MDIPFSGSHGAKDFGELDYQCAFCSNFLSVATGFLCLHTAQVTSSLEPKKCLFRSFRILGFLSLPGVVARRVDATVLLAFSFWFAVCRFCQAGFSLDLDKRRKSKD